MTHDYAVMTFWADESRAIDPESYLSSLVVSCYMKSVWEYIFFFSFQTLQPESGVSFSFFFFFWCFHMWHGFHQFTVHCLYENNGQNACSVRVVLFGRLTHPSNLMHRVIFLPLTAPLAPADINWMRKQNARLYVVEVVEECKAVGWSVFPGQLGVE